MSESSPRLLIVGPTFLNVYPSRHSDNEAYGYIGGYAAWTALAARYTLRQELEDRVEAARKSPGKSAADYAPDFGPPPFDDSKDISAILTARKRARAVQMSMRPEQKVIISPEVRIEDTHVSALTTLGAHHPDAIHRGVRAIFTEYGIRILASASRMPVDIYDLHDLSTAKITKPVRDNPSFDIRDAYKAFDDGTEEAPTIVIFNGYVLGDKETRDDNLNLANLLRKRGSFVFADLRAPTDERTATDKKTVEGWGNVAHSVKISHHELRRITGEESSGNAATKFLNYGADLFLDTKGNSGASAWWRAPGLTHRAFTPGEDYTPKVKFKAGAASDASFALAFLKFGVNASNLTVTLKHPEKIGSIGNDAVKRTTEFLKDADRAITERQKPTQLPSPSHHIAEGPTIESIVRVIYPKYRNG